MWQKLLRHFESPPVDPAARQRLAVAVLLLECSRADFDQSVDELTQVRSSLQRYFGLDAAGLEALLAEAGEQVRQAVSLHEFVGSLNASLQPADKLQIMRMLWQVAYADGRLDVHEEHLLRKFAELLYVPHKDFIATKLEAAAQVQSQSGSHG